MNLPWRLETSGRITPLPGRRLAGFESDETWTIGATFALVGADGVDGATAATSHFVEGTQGIRYTVGAVTTATVFNTAQGPFDVQTGPYATTPNFGTADPGHADVHLRVFVNAGNANYGGGHLQIGDNAGANVRRWYWPATLAAGENLLVLPYNASLVVGVAPTTAGVRTSITMTTAGAGTIDITFDDLYIAYTNGGPIGADMGEAHKSILFQSGVTTIPFRDFFSNPNNPSYFTPTDVLDIFDKVALDPRIEVRALKSFFDTLIVGTYNTIFGINGSNRDTFTISEQSSGQGISDHRSVVPFGDTFLYRFKNRFYAYSVSSLQAISLPEEPLLDVIDERQVTVGVRWIRQNAIWWTFLDSGGAQQVLQWDYGSGQKAWGTLTMTMLGVFPYTAPAPTNTNELLTLGTDGLLYLQDRTGQFAGVDFSAVIETRWLGAETAAQVRKWLRAYLLFDTDPLIGVGVS